jgi:hypothetical protein
MPLFLNEFEPDPTQPLPEPIVAAGPFPDWPDLATLPPGPMDVMEYDGDGPRCCLCRRVIDPRSDYAIYGGAQDTRYLCSVCDADESKRLPPPLANESTSALATVESLPECPCAAAGSCHASCPCPCHKRAPMPRTPLAWGA